MGFAKGVDVAALQALYAVDIAVHAGIESLCFGDIGNEVGIEDNLVKGGVV